MKLIELSQAIEHWHQTKSVAEANEICEQLYQDMGEQARNDYAEPTIHIYDEGNPTEWLNSLSEEERAQPARKADELQAKNLGGQA